MLTSNVRKIKKYLLANITFSLNVFSEYVIASVKISYFLKIKRIVNLRKILSFSKTRLFVHTQLSNFTPQISTTQFKTFK